MSDKCGAPADGGPCVLPRGHNMGRLDVSSNHHWEAAADPETALLDWLIDIAYPFDTVFDPAPPVDLKRLALRWKEREGWTDVSDEDAIACIEEEANCA